MLHSMLWTGLRQDLKDISGHKYDTIRDFNTLRVALRQIEKDHLPQKAKTNIKPNTAKSATPPAETSSIKTDVEELKGMVQQLTHKVSSMEQQSYTPYYNRGAYTRGNRGSGRRPYSRPP